MSTSVTDAKIGSLYRQKRQAEKRLLKRRNDAKQLVSNLRVLAECFDEDNADATITKVDGDRFWYRYRSREGEINESRGERDAPVDFPQEAMDIATDIYNLEREIDSLGERLNLAVECA